MLFKFYYIIYYVYYIIYIMYFIYYIYIMYIIIYIYYVYYIILYYILCILNIYIYVYYIYIYIVCVMSKTKNGGILFSQGHYKLCQYHTLSNGVRTGNNTGVQEQYCSVVSTNEISWMWHRRPILNQGLCRKRHLILLLWGRYYLKLNHWKVQSPTSQWFRRLHHA
jgi:hypothetical protein